MNSRGRDRFRADYLRKRTGNHGRLRIRVDLRRGFESEAWAAELARTSEPSQAVSTSRAVVGDGLGSSRRWLSTTASATSISFRPVCCEWDWSISNALS